MSVVPLDTGRSAASELVPVEAIRSGDRIALAHGRVVTVQRVDTFDDGATWLVRWWRHAELGEPGYCRPDLKPIEDQCDGRLLGSLQAFPAGHRLTVERGPSARPGASRG